MERNTTENTPQLNINHLLGCYIVEGKTESGSFRKRDNDLLLDIESNLKDPAGRFINVKYEYEDIFLDYDIRIEAVESNLGKGYNYYFLCPVSNKRAKILYLCNETYRFIHRSVYPNRLYYPIELIPVKYRLPERLAISERKLFNKFLQMKRMKYQGRETRLNILLSKWIEKHRTLDALCAKHMQQNF